MLSHPGALFTRANYRFERRAAALSTTIGPALPRSFLVRALGALLMVTTVGAVIALKAAVFLARLDL